jgi:BCD family chlorophyll transporter-like MFS transporter
LLAPALSAPATAYTAVYTLEVVLLLATVAAMVPLLRRSVQPVPT